VSNTVHLAQATGSLIIVGNAAPTLSFRVGSTFDLDVVFLDDAGKVTELPSGTTGSLIIKPLGEYLESPLYIAHWQAAGSGLSRRYRFSAVMDSQPLRDAVATTTSMAMQIVWNVGAAPYAAQSLTCTLEPSYYAPGDLPPPLLGSTEREDWNQTLINPEQEWTDLSTYAGNVTTGGSITALRLSVAEYHPGGQVKITSNGTTLLNWRDITAQSELVPLNALALASVPTGARLDVQVQWLSGTAYTLRARGLELGIVMRSQTLDASSSWDWLKARIPAGGSVTHSDGPQTISISSSGSGSLPTGVALVALSEDGLYVEFRHPTTSALIARVLRAE